MPATLYDVPCDPFPAFSFLFSGTLRTKKERVNLYTHGCVWSACAEDDFEPTYCSSYGARHSIFGHTNGKDLVLLVHDALLFLKSGARNASSPSLALSLTLILLLYMYTWASRESASGGRPGRRRRPLHNL